MVNVRKAIQDLQNVDSITITKQDLYTFIFARMLMLVLLDVLNEHTIISKIV